MRMDGWRQPRASKPTMSQVRSHHESSGGAHEEISLPASRLEGVWLWGLSPQGD